MKNKKMFMEYMTLLGEIHDKEISDTLKNVYWKALQHFTDEECKKAFDNFILTSKFFPKPAHFNEVIRGIDNSDPAIEAWARVDEAMRKYGSYISLNFNNPKIHKCIELLGGWEYLGGLSEDDWKWKRKEFETAYRGMRSNDGPTHVTGTIEKDNLLRGYGDETFSVISLPDKLKEKLLSLT